MKRIFAFLLCMLMCMSLLPVISFAEGSYSISVTGGTADQSTADEGAVVAVTAAVPENKTFKEWTSTPAVVFSDSKAASATFSMPAADVSIEAVCENAVQVVRDEETSYSITVTNGTADKTSAAAGTTVSVEASVPEGKVFREWTGSQGVSFANSRESITTFTMPDSNVSVSAGFESAPTRGGYAITITGATEDTPSSAAAGATVTITAAVPDGKAFKNWTSTTEGVNFKDAETTPTTFTMPDHPVTIEAKFEDAASYSITVTGGTASPAEATAGKTVTVTASVPDGKTFKAWTSSTAGVDFADATKTSTTFTMPGRNVAITATFEGEGSGSDETVYDITVTGGTSNPSKSAAGKTVTVTATVPEGKTFKKWTSTTEGVIFADATKTPATFTMPARNVSVTAEFTEGYIVTFDTVLPSGITINNAPEPQEVPQNGTATKPTDPSDAAQHHKFLGWYKSDGTEFKFDTKITSNITLYAKWKHPYNEGVCVYCWEAKPSFSEVKQPGFKPEITRGIIGKPPSTAHYGSTHSFTVDTYYPYVKDSVDVYVDGKWIKPEDQYYLKKGSTIVTLRPWYIKTLAEGEHSILIDSNLGTAKGVFRVSKSPKTGDDSNVALWVTTGVISAAAVAGIAYYLIKKRKK